MDGLTLTDAALQLSVLAAGPDDEEAPVAAPPLDDDSEHNLPLIAGFGFGEI